MAIEESSFGSGAVVTVCISGPLPRTKTGRMSLVKRTVQAASRRWSRPLLFVFPAGLLNAGRERPDQLIDWASTQIAAILQESAPSSKVSLGVDGRETADQLALGVSAAGLEALGRKFHPERGGIEVAPTPFATERGRMRTLDFHGKTFYLAMCYDVFGLRNHQPPKPVHAVLVNIHEFTKSGDGSGASHFARYGLAGASAAWGCPVFGAAHFESATPPMWPSGVRASGCADLRQVTYADIQIGLSRFASESCGENEISLTLYELS